MNQEQRQAYEWAKKQNYPSVAARYAKILARLVDEITPPNEPLTLEQLRKMDGQPVWCEWLLPEDRAVEDGKWFIVIVGEKTGLEIKRPTDYGDYFLKTEDYGKTWLAYAYPPAHIDREAWKPCEECENKNCDNCLFSEYLSSMEPCKSCCSAKKWQPISRFCFECGRPQTEEAWAELEKRLRGVRD